MKKNIAVILGDGIGPEVTQQSIKVLQSIAEQFNHANLFAAIVPSHLFVKNTLKKLPN